MRKMPIPLSEQKSNHRPEALKKYDRLKHTDDEVKTLRVRGFVPVVSSNVSAVGKDDKDLIVRFHCGATYVYPGSEDLYQPMLNASSKGRFVWNRIRKAGVRYFRTRNYNLKDDVEDRDMMKPMAETNVTVDTLSTNEAKAQTVEQAEASETVIDIEQTQIPKEQGKLNDLAAASLGTTKDAIALGLIMELAEDEDENNSRQA